MRHRGRVGVSGNGATSADRGATLIIIALSITALFTITALVIDLSSVRQNRQTDKSASDFAAAAGIRGLDDGSGSIFPWKGICTARDYLMANGAEFAGLTDVSFTDGAEAVSYASDPCDSPSNAPYTTPCTSSSLAKSTWGIYRGEADGGRLRVTIRSGYVLPDPDFPEDSDEYDEDDGAASSHGCDHLAVIVEEREGAKFGGIVGASGHETRIRSVARVVEGFDGDVTAALVLLEQHDCKVLDISGTNATVRVLGNDASPGVIHSDSLGNGDSCGKIFSVNDPNAPPNIITENAESIDPVTGVLAPGQISTFALSGHSDAESGHVSDGLDRVCSRTKSSDCGSSPVAGDSPIERELVGRAKVDARYREPIIDLRDEAAERFGWITEAQANAAGFVRVDCDAPGPFTDAKVWVDCGGGAFEGNGKTFESTVDEVVLNGYVTYSGPTPRFLQFTSPSKLFIAGRDGVAISVNNNDRMFVNDGGASDGDSDGFVCDDRFSSAPAARTEMVIGKGELTTNGGVVRLCQTTLFMMDNSSGNCAVPTFDGREPYDNGCGGTIGGQGTTFYDWTAPNVNNVSAPTEDQLKEFEDLALWSETQSGWSLAGGGGLFLRGIFFTPNADPFKITGGGDTDVADSQFVTRRLEVAGDGEILLKPDWMNSIQVPALKGFTLVR